MVLCCVFLFSKFIQDKYGDYSQKEAAYVAGAVYDSSLVLSASVGILIVSTCTQNPLYNQGKRYTIKL